MSTKAERIAKRWMRRTVQRLRALHRRWLGRDTFVSRLVAGKQPPWLLRAEEAGRHRRNPTRKAQR